MKRYLTADEAAEYLGLTRDAIYQKCRNRGLPHIRDGRWLRFDKQDLDFWMARRRVNARSAS